MYKNTILLLGGSIIIGYNVVYIYINRYRLLLKIFNKMDYLIDFKNWIKNKCCKSNKITINQLNDNKIIIKHIITKSYHDNNYNIPILINSIDVKNGVTCKDNKNYLNLNHIKQSFVSSTTPSDNCIEIGYEFNNNQYQHIFTDELFDNDELEIEKYLNPNFQKSVKIPIDNISLMNNEDYIKLDITINNNLIKILESYKGPLSTSIKMKYIKNNIIAMLNDSILFSKLIVNTMLLEEFEYNDNDILIN